MSEQQQTGSVPNTGCQRPNAPLLTPDQQAVVMAITIKLAQLGHEVVFTQPVTTGPLVTTFRFLPRNATKVSAIVGCADDIALTLHVEDVLVRRLPGEGSIGVSVPNKERSLVFWRDLLKPPPGFDFCPVPLNFGVTSEGTPFREDLTQLPHLLIAGSTNGGKSVLLHSMIASLMIWRSPEQVRFALSDTKGVEFNHFDGAPHLWCPTVKTMYATWELMDYLADEVDRRLKILGCWGCRNISDYHKQNPNHKMPFIVFVVDELADVLGGDKRGESKLASAKLGRIVQKARATGIHVISATQRPSVDIVAGSIKNNFPARLTFKLPSQTDSRTVIGHSGAEHLLAKGDMLYSSPNHPAIRRLHSGYATTDDIVQCVAFAAQQQSVKT